MALRGSLSRGDSQVNRGEPSGFQCSLETNASHGWHWLQSSGLPASALSLAESGGSGRDVQQVVGRASGSPRQNVIGWGVGM